MKLNQGWKIKYFCNIKKVEDSKKDKKNKSNKIYIFVLGYSNRGKTYIFQKICKEELIYYYHMIYNYYYLN